MLDLPSLGGSRSVDDGGHAEPLDDAGRPNEDSAACRAAPWLLFELSKETTTSLYAMRADGTQGHRLKLGHQAGYASLSVPGTQLLYVGISTEPNDAGYLNTLSEEDLPSGPSLPLATSLVQNDIEDETLALTYSALSPDGKTVAYTHGYDVRLVNVDGSNDRLLLQGSTDSNFVYGHPSFTNDSQTVLYGFVTTFSAFGSIHVDGSAMTTLVTEDGPGPQYPNPTLSPDGTSVASAIGCAGDDAGATTKLRVYPFASLPAPCASGRIVTVVDDNFSGGVNPAWGPSGLIAYGSGNDVYVVDASGGTRRNMTAALTPGTDAAFDPIWAPACAPIP
jgi:hypothetical protein